MVSCDEKKVAECTCMQWWYYKDVIQNVWVIEFKAQKLCDRSTNLSDIIIW